MIIWMDIQEDCFGHGPYLLLGRKSSNHPVPSMGLQIPSDSPLPQPDHSIPAVHLYLIPLPRGMSVQLPPSQHPSHSMVHPAAVAALDQRRRAQTAPRHAHQDLAPRNRVLRMTDRWGSELSRVRHRESLRPAATQPAPVDEGRPTRAPRATAPPRR